MVEGLERTHEILDQSDPPKLADENSSHLIYFCPECITKRGKPDNDGKLYWDKTKHIGICFKCDTVFHPKPDEEADPTVTDLDMAIDRTNKELTGLNFVHPPAIGFAFDEPGTSHLDYLRSRHPFLPPLAKLLGVKGWSGTNLGVVFPFIYRDHVARFQVRFKTDDKAKRYYTSPGEHKILYSPTHLLSDFRLRGEDTVTIVEGVFDAIAALILGYPNPVAILGSSLTDYNAYLIRKLVPENAFIFMDSEPLNLAVEKTLRTSCPSIGGISRINFGDDVDPEEYLKSELKNPANFRSYASNVADIIERYK